MTALDPDLDPDAVREVLQVFVDTMPTGWKVYERGDQFYAGRRFEYRNGAQALLSARPERWIPSSPAWLHAEVLDRVRVWSVQVNVPFAAGPEAEASGKLAHIEEWVEQRNGWLALPLSLQECKRRDEAEAIAATLPAAALVLLATVFDIDIYESRKQIVRAIAAACVPGAAKARA